MKTWLQCVSGHERVELEDIGGPEQAGMDKEIVWRNV